MKQTAITRATLGRLPVYLQYIRSYVRDETISASAIARGLGLGEVQVRKDLSLVCAESKPKIGYQTEKLLSDLEEVLGVQTPTPAVVVGAGKLGLALLDYEGFSEYGLKIVAAFDTDTKKVGTEFAGKPICPMEQLTDYCGRHDIHIGILTVPASVAQKVCENMTQSGITAIWSFAPCKLIVPETVTIKQENLALSLAHLQASANQWNKI